LDATYPTVARGGISARTRIRKLVRGSDRLGGCQRNFDGSINNLMPIVRGGDVADPGRDSTSACAARAP